MPEDPKAPDTPSNPGSPDGEKRIQAKIILPSQEEVGEGLARLESCLPHWETTPGLLIIKPELAALVRVSGHVHDAMGFRLHLRIEERLLDFAVPHPETFALRCGWNQPYMSFNDRQISAPYSFTLYFGVEGVAQARELHAMLSEVERKTGSYPIGPQVFRGCFDYHRGDYLQEMRKIFLKPDAQ